MTRAHFARFGFGIRRVLTATTATDTSRCCSTGSTSGNVYTPRTNGKAERFIQTALRMGLARTYQNSEREISLTTTSTAHMLASTVQDSVNNLLSLHS